VLLLGPRSGSKTRTFGIPDGLPPGPLRELLPIRVVQVSSLRPGLEVPVRGAGSVDGAAVRWREHVESGLEPLAAFADGGGVLYGQGDRFYLACWPDARLLRAVTRELLGGRAGLPLVDLPEAVRLRHRGDLAFAFNYGDAPWAAPVPAGAPLLIGTQEVAPQDMACWRMGAGAGTA
jgi:beta-galactosidase